MSVLVVAAFALAWWLGCYLLARDPTRPLLHRAAAALLTYATGVACGLLAPYVDALPLATLEQVLLCVPPLAWAGVAVGLLAEDLPERRQIERGWALTSVLLLAMVPALPSPGRLVVLAPMIGAVVVLWRFRDGTRRRTLTGPLTVAAGLYAAALAVVLLPVDVGAHGLLLAALGLDLLILGFVAAVADADDAGERLRPDLRRSFAGALFAGLLAGGPTALALAAAEPSPALVALQLVAVVAAMVAVTVEGAVRRSLDRIAFFDDEPLRAEREALWLAADALPRRRERHRVGELDEEEFHRLTRRALQHFRDTGRLLRSPLADLPVVTERLLARGVPPEVPLARVTELRAVLREAVAALKPNGAYFGTTEDWRYYNAVYFCFVVGLRPYRRGGGADALDRDARRALEWFRRHVPERNVRLWQAVGARLVAERLWRQARAGGVARPATRDQERRHSAQNG
ncbi:hypothetical protein [Spirilliplanes yamanashiensis]|uniref:hypothetical protein n=1 Tax=Spirilliplanes yamanashiensis TaxID=42233 RepID=UPI00194FF067|nr:hypothetical protein [Spirilliplanes yamanashiensis]MDP9819898.1 hypothetical protein [Spirilliplanes yamanashiensis]